MTKPIERIAFLLFEGVTVLDLIGPAQVLSRLGSVKVDLVAASMAPVATDAGFPLLPTATFDAVENTDLLCVPGGFGTLKVMEDAVTLDWVRRAGESAQWVTSVCTGSLILGAAGLLTGYRAACHWASRHQLAWFGATPDPARVVFDRNRVTGGGVTAGIDFALALMAAIRGEEYAKMVQLSLEYDPHPPFDSGSPEKAGPARVEAYQQFVRARVGDRDEAVKAIARKIRPDRPPVTP